MDDMKIQLSENLGEYPDIKIGIMEIRNIVNKKFDSKLEAEKRKLEVFIRKGGQEFENSDVIKSYDRFFKKYGKTYPIQFQIKSIVNGQNFPAVSTIVESMFMGELKSMFLTAGHDLDLLKGELKTSLANGGEKYEKINGKEQELKQGDIVTEDDEDIISSVLYGPDRRTSITMNTKNCLFFSYFLCGEDDSNIRQHFHNILDYIRIFSEKEPDTSNVAIFTL